MIEQSNICLEREKGGSRVGALKLRVNNKFQGIIFFDTKQIEHNNNNNEKSVCAAAFFVFHSFDIFI